jgi:hypothetical protein
VPDEGFVALHVPLYRFIRCVISRFSGVYVAALGTEFARGTRSPCRHQLPVSGFTRSMSQSGADERPGD